jgi:hypothetical protein
VITVIGVVGAAAATYVVNVVITYISERRYRRRMEDEYGPIRWGQSEFVSALKLTIRLPMFDPRHKPDDPA